jgi:hypothetical protein
MQPAAAAHTGCIVFKFLATFPALVRPVWPLPALGCWLTAWAVFGVVSQFLAAPAAALGATVVGIAAAWSVDGRWRRLLAAAGFPLSALALVPLAAWPGWVWALAAALLLAGYPMRAWRDAPFFPTQPAALQDLGRVVVLHDGARVLDAGCGAGHGLQALRRAYPHARLEGVEWSRPLAWWAALSCPWARVCRGDMWELDWSGYALVYLFQRPESMARAAAKAVAELPAGAWLVSLEFPVPECEAYACLRPRGGRPVWVYRMAARSATSPSTAGAPRR